MAFPTIYQHLSRDRQRFTGTAQWLVFRCLPALLCMLLWLLALSAAKVRAADVSEEQITAGQLTMTDALGNTTYALTQRTKAEVAISGMVAVVELKQHFVNTSTEWVEGVYAFPLPDEAAARHMVLEVGERRIVGKIREKKAAIAAYAEARKEGKRASLVSQNRPNLFTSRVANIAPGESVAVALEYVQPVNYRHGAFSLRLPTTITARYIPGEVDSTWQDRSLHILPGQGWALPTRQVPDAPAITPLQHARPGADSNPVNALDVSVRLDAGMPLASVASPYHQIVLSRQNSRYEVALAGGEAEMNRDFVLSWKPVVGEAPSAAMFTERVDDTLYGMMMVLPPSVEQSPPALPRDVIMVIDTSGSMDGAPIRQARASLRGALQRLQPEDRFNIIAFDTGFQSLFREARPATNHYLQQASEFVRHLQAGGGTEMLPALRAAMQRDAAKDDGQAETRIRQVIFITDGAVGNESALFAELAANMGSSRLFTVGIGSAPNSWFMRKAAEYGRGSYTFIANVDEVNERMSALFQTLAAPVALDMEVQWPAGVEAWPRRLPDLYQGEPLVVAVKFGENLPDEPLTISGQIAGQSWRTALHWPEAEGGEKGGSHPGVATLWARNKIEQLLSERATADSAETVREQVLAVALGHSLLSPYTSFLAIEEIVSRPSDASLKVAPVPNTRPQGQGAQPYAYAQTATTTRAKVWLAAFLMLLVLLIRSCRLEEHD